MRYIAFTIILLLIVLPLASPHGGVAGTIEPNFKEHLKHLASNQVAQALVMMSDRVDVKAIERSFGNNPTLRERHRAVVSALIEKAKSTQEGLILFLESQRRLDSVSSYRPYWITNMIAVTATREVIEEIAARADVEKVYEDFEVIPYEPVTMDRSGPGSMGTEPNLAQIHADSLWMWGITGYGTLVCNIDTGVDGNHPALASRWRGLDPGVNWWEAWYDPVTDSLFPFDDGFHGTHTMGIMCGYDEDNDHHIGVAYDAKWIAASVIDRVGGPGRFSVYASAFEWAADPDSNPATIEDVPDVISNSWGIGWDLPACDETFWEVIDNCEAAGSIVLFAAGNEGPWPQSLRNPADRNTTPLNVLAVGATEGDSMIAYFSSRGPSTCDDESKKPEICAPGVSIVSSVPGGNYNAYNGTSMACPHVAGAAALLREVDPDAPPELVKEALYLSAQEVKYDSIPGEDNNYGMGLLDCAAAYHYLTELTTFTDISSSCGIQTSGVLR
jgi:bacillopeptidase F